MVDWVFVRFGFMPVSHFIKSIQGIADFQVNAEGYINIDSQTRTSIAGVYAVGDITGLQPSSIINAVAHGALAAQSIEMDLR